MALFKYKERGWLSLSIFDTMKNALKITYETREKIRQAIIDKGVDVPSGTSFDEYSNKIADIEIKSDEYYKNLIKWKKIAINLQKLFLYLCISEGYCYVSYWFEKFYKIFRILL